MLYNKKSANSSNYPKIFRRPSINLLVPQFLQGSV